MTLAPLSLLPIYLALQATAHHVDVDAPLSADDILSVISQRVLPGAETNKRVIQAAQEVARAAGGELHNVAALTGGLVAQETIKIITKQYIPIDNTCIYDGIAGRCQVLRL
jgi:amyloid beta precursor protein binding protein 1